ncbi:MAG TPA: class I SAM-dependent methyltransferase [Gemmataceae bacterium]|jgi:hypothetical protein
MDFSEIDGWFNFADVYDLALSRARGGECFVEVGAWMGRSTVYMADAIKRLGKSIRFFAVDHFRGSPTDGAHAPVLADLAKQARTLHDVFRANLEACGVRDYVTPLVMDSAQAAAAFDDASVDFCFLDADHSYDSVLADIRLWLPKIKPGGILAGDDFGWEGVARAVRTVFGGRFRLSRGSYKSWIVDVPARTTRGAIVTIDRTPEPYLAATLASAQSRAGGPILFDLFVGDERTAYLRECDPSAIGKVDALPDEATQGLSVHLRHTLNYSRILLHHGLILEDDLIFCPAWDAWLRDSLDDCRRRREDDRFVLALYSCYGWDNTSLVVNYPVEAFYGFQAMYFPPAVRTPFHLHLLRNFGREPTDLLLKSFCREEEVSLFACSQSLVQHVGTRSTGLGDFHQTGNFRGLSD